VQGLSWLSKQISQLNGSIVWALFAQCDHPHSISFE
jgi:hypothetical protein